MDFETYDKIAELMGAYFGNARDTLELIYLAMGVISLETDVRVENSISLVINQIDQGINAIEEYLTRKRKEEGNHEKC